MHRIISSRSLFAVPLVFSTALAFTTAALRAVDPAPPASVVDLLAGELEERFLQHLNEGASLSTDFKEVWVKTDEGHLQVTGKGLGYLRSHQAWRDYHVVMEYQWTERTFGDRADRARDGGLLFHIVGANGAFGGTWPACLQAQLIEGGSGDLVALPTDSTPSGFTASATLADLPIWSPSGTERRFPLEGKKTAHLGWENRSENWKDVKGFRGELDLENPVGEWNRLEVICDGDQVEILLNGVRVNLATGVQPAGGSIGLQTEFAGYLVRRLEVHPVGGFAEKWEDEARSTDMGYSISGESILPRRFPLSVDDSAQSWEIDGDYEIQLVASEPLTCDPVDVVWDERGRMFVAEMGDYPLPPSEDGTYLSRIRLLADTTGDGIMNTATTWADNLDHVQGLLPLNGGILATTRTAILFLQDTTGDDVADVREVLFHSNEPRHNQLQVSSPRYGLDNHVYLSNGLDGKEIYPDDDPENVTAFPRLNLRYDLRTGEMKPSTGFGQFGGTLDEFGRHFFCSNRSPAMFAVMPLEAVERNPLAGITVGHEDIKPPASPVRPLALSHTTSSAHAGTYTAACGVGIYTGDWIGELHGDLFVCEPTGQLVTRNRLSPKGSSFHAEHLGETREFLASRDEWSRPVQIRNGPDGALYVVDMYRRFIDHSRFLPEDFAKSHYMRAGLDQGRIWRVVPKNSEARTTEPLPEDSADLVPLLGHANGWTRTTAQRLLLEKKDDRVVPALNARLQESPGPVETVHLLWTLAGFDSLTSDHLATALEHSDPGVVENALLAARETHQGGAIAQKVGDLIHQGSPRPQFLALSLFPEVKPERSPLSGSLAKDPSDAWLRKAVMSSHPEQIPGILTDLLADETFLSGDPEVASDALEDLARFTAATSELEGLAELFQQLEGEPYWWHFAVVAGVSEGLRRSELKQKNLAALISAAPPELGDGNATLKNLLDTATEVALNRERAEADRIMALTLVAQRPWEEKIAAVERLIEPVESPGVQAAACQILSREDREKVAEFFFERWDSLPPTPLREALALITGNAKSGLALMKRMKAGEISPSLMPPMTRWSYGRSTNEEVKALALELFGQTAGNRSEIVAKYREAIKDLTGDPERGEFVFHKGACVTCHEMGEIGVNVGPSLDDVKIKPDEALLSDILDPNRAIEERWIAMTIESTGGRILTGLVDAEDAESITIRLPGGLTETVPRSEIAKVNSSGYSLMPDGLEAAIDPQEMADLLAFLKKPKN